MSEHGSGHLPPPPPPPRGPAPAWPPSPPPWGPAPAAPTPYAVSPAVGSLPPDTPRPGRSRVIVGVAVAMLFTLIAVVVAALVARDRDGPGATTPPIPSNLEIPAAPTSTVTSRGASGASGSSGAAGSNAAPTTTRANTEFDRTVDTIIAFVEKTRGLKYKTRPVVIALSEQDFLARFQALTEEDYRKHRVDYDAATVVLSALGLLKPGVSYYETTKAFGAAGVLGFYDPETKELSVRGSASTPFVRTVIAHELTHALDDQWFDLDRPQYDGAKDEIGFGFSALAEGNARRVEKVYRASLSSADRTSADREEASYSGAFQANQFTTAFLKLQLAPYSLGEAFVRDLLDLGGQPALDAAFAAPPTTSEEVIDVDKYVAKEGRVAVAPPPADGTVVDDGVVGEIVIQYLLESVVSTAQATRAATGWAGDWYVAWSAAGASCLRLAIQMDTANDTTDLKSAFDKWVASRPKATVTASGKIVTVTSCTQ